MFWTTEENALVTERGTFTLAIKFVDDVSEYLYEYDPIIEKILHLSDNNIHYGRGMKQYQRVQIIPREQYVLVRQDDKFNVEVLGQYSSNDIAVSMIKNDQSKLTEETNNVYHYVIINLRNTTPYFLKLGRLTQINKDKPGEFYWMRRVNKDKPGEYYIMKI